MRNIEIKVRADQPANLRAEVAKLASAGPTTLEQDDTFFQCAAGRLKLRDFLDGTGELIFYRRADERGPKESFYLRSATSAPEALRETLLAAYGQSGRVRKHRTLFLIGRTRVHLDEVLDLGYFLELEVVLRDEESAEVGTREAMELMRMLNIDTQQLIECAYVDLLAGES